MEKQVLGVLIAVVVIAALVSTAFWVSRKINKQ